MDLLTFIAEIIKAVAWPTAIIIITFRFHLDIKTLLTRLIKGKVGPAEFEFRFEEKVHILKSERISHQSDSIEKPNDNEIKNATINPRLAVVDAWLQIEDAIGELFEKKNLLNLVSRRNSSLLVKTIRERKLLSPHYADLLDNLRRLRNDAVHMKEFKPSIESVMAYIQLTKDVLAEIHKALV